MKWFPNMIIIFICITILATPSGVPRGRGGGAVASLGGGARPVCIGPNCKRKIRPRQISKVTSLQSAVADAGFTKRGGGHPEPRRRQPCRPMRQGGGGAHARIQVFFGVIGNPPYGCLQFFFACWFAQDPATIWIRSWNSCTKPPLLNVRNPPSESWIRPWC